MSMQPAVIARPEAVAEPPVLYRQAEGVAAACREIVEATAVEIGTAEQKRKYVKVEGWQAIANGFGCVASARDVEKVYDPASGDFLGFKAIGEVKRTNDGMIVSSGEGFVGIDEPRWFGGTVEAWSKRQRKMVTKTYRPAAEYAVRAMAQTRAVSRACRAAFAFIVVMINKELDTTPAEEVAGGDDAGREEEMIPRTDEPAAPAPAKEPDANGGGGVRSVSWRDYRCEYGTKNGPLRGRKLGELTVANLRFLYEKFVESGLDVSQLSRKDQDMVVGLKLWYADERGAQA